MASIECTRFWPLDKGFLRGFATVWVEKWGVEIDGFTMWEKEGKRWINLPSDEYVDKESGEKKYKPVLRFRNKEHMKLFLEAVRVAIDEFIVKMSEEAAQPDLEGSDDGEGVPF